MKRKLSRSLLVLAAAAAGLVLVAGATGTSTSLTKAIPTHGFVVALALDGSRAAYGNGSKIVV